MLGFHLQSRGQFVGVMFWQRCYEKSPVIFVGHAALMYLRSLFHRHLINRLHYVFLIDVHESRLLITNGLVPVWSIGLGFGRNRDEIWYNGFALARNKIVSRGKGSVRIKNENTYSQSYTYTGTNHTGSWYNINDNIRRQAQWYYNFGKWGMKRRFMCPKFISAVNLHMWWAENRVQSARGVNIILKIENNK